MTPSPLPSVRLKPKSDARRLRQGAPWVYANDLVADRRTRGLEPGSFAMLEDAGRTPIAVVTVNPASKIIARVMDRDTGTVIDSSWVAGRIQAALAHRARLYPQPFYRWVHAEGDGLPGVIIDRFGAIAVVQPNAAWAERHFDWIEAALLATEGVTAVIKNGSGRARTLEGLDDAVVVTTGQVCGPVQVPMNGALYLADLLGGQKTGLFFDQRPNHAFFAPLAKGGEVLDVFSHVGGFGLAGLAAGATSALAVDGSAPALDLARQGADAMGCGDRFETRHGDAFDALSRLQDEGRRFDAVVCDPPAFAPTKQALDAGLRAYEKVARLAGPLVRPGGYLGLCSCSHAAGLDAFRAASIRGIGRAGRSVQLIHTGFAGPDHPQHPGLAETAYLKALFFRVLA